MSIKVKSQKSKVKTLRRVLSTLNLRPSITRVQRGDTIVEVLVALSVIAVTLAAAFGLANGAVRTGRAAQERTEALKIAESQIEIMKSYLAINGTVTTGVSPFCMNDVGVPLDATSDAYCMDTDGDGGGGLYTMSAEEVSAGSYRFDVTWDRDGSPVAGVVDLYYRVGPL